MRRKWAGRLSTRPSVLVAIVATAVLSAVAGMIAGATIRSPDDIARARAAPALSEVTVPVEFRELTSAVITRGDVRAAVTVDVAVPADVGTATGATAAVVTGRIPADGASLDEGQIVLEASGRPMFLLTGSLPMFRTLGPGASGADVAQLEAALDRLGLDPGTVDEDYTAQTGSAVALLYRDSGYDPVRPADEDRGRLDAAQAAAASARTARDAAEAAADQARVRPPAADVRLARAQLELARQQRDDARATRDGALAAAAEPDRARVQREQDVLVAQAEVALNAAEETVTTLTAPRSTTEPDRAAADARDALDTAESEFTDIEATIGVSVPLSEIVFVPVLPARVQNVTAVLGATPEVAALALVGGDPVVDAEVSPAVADQIATGVGAELTDSAGVRVVPGEISFIADRPGTDGAAPTAHRIRITPTGPDAGALFGLNVRVSVPVTSTSGPVLAVPVTALYTAADGAVRVRRVGSEGPVELDVEPGLVADGLVELRRVDGELAVGDRVTVS